MIELAVLGSGSKGNCTLIRTESSAILIDAGLSARQLIQRLESVGQDPGSIEAILLTHNHTDHICGLRVFDSKYPILVLANEATLHAARPFMGDNVAREAFDNNSQFTAGAFKISPFPVSHDAADPVGFVVVGDGIHIGYATDLGQIDQAIINKLAGCEIIVLESNHDRTMLWEGPYPHVTKQRIDSPYGHLSNECASSILPEIVGPNTAHLILAHISQTNNERRLAHREAVDALEHASLNNVSVTIAFQNRPTEPVTC